MKHSLFIFFLFFVSSAFSQLSKVDNLIKNKQYRLAETELNKYVKGAGKLANDPKVKSEISGYRKRIKDGLDELYKQERIKQERLADAQDFANVLDEARTFLYQKNYVSAIEKVDEAERDYWSDEASTNLRSSIYLAWSNSFIAEGNKAFNNNDYYEARRQYQFAQEKYNDYEVQERLNALNSKISSHENYVNEAKTAFNNQEFDKALTKLEAASKIIKLGPDGEELKRKCNLFKYQTAGDNALLNQQFDEALTQYEKANAYASKSDEKSTLENKKNEAKYNKLSAQALVAFNEKKYMESITFLYEAKEIHALESEELALFNKAAVAYDEQTWGKISSSSNEKDFLDYLNVFLGGAHREEARKKLSLIYEANGDNFLKNHNYSGALDSYGDATKFSNDSRLIQKKIAKTYRWRDNLSTDFSIVFGLPVGYNQTSVETEDDYSYIYHIGNNQTIAETGNGIQRLYSHSLITPISFAINKSFTLRIPNVQPMNINLSLSYTSNSNSNLNRVNPTNYEVYDEIYEPSSQVIVSTDTLSTYFSNAYKFNQYQLKIGFQPFSFVEIFLPISKQTLYFQNDFSSLEVAQDDYKIGGDLVVGLGIKAGYTFRSGLGLYGYYENWNKSFNKRLTTNQLVDPKQNASDGLFSLKPFSRSVGLIFSVPISDRADVQFSAINNRIRGNYRGAVSNEALRGFYQNLFTISFKYSLQ